MEEYNRRFNRVFVTGDVHGDIADLTERIKKIENPTKDDLLILLGDCGFFFDCRDAEYSPKDVERRKRAAELPITLLCVQGNHEVPFDEMDAEEIELLGGEGYHKDGIFFAENGTTLELNDKTALVIGGAYSADWSYRKYNKMPLWKDDEEMTDEELEEVIEENKNEYFDFIFTHTCAMSDMEVLKHVPDLFLTKQPKRTERALERIKDTVDYEKWFCGHFHIEFQTGSTRFIYKDIEQII